MNILIIGYGKMGKLIEKTAIGLGHNVVSIVDENDDFPIYTNNKPDVAIEFTNPNSVLKNIDNCFAAGIPMVVGTTGWNKNIAEVSKKCELAKGSLIYASNFSVGVNIWFDILDFASKQFSKIAPYSPSIIEKHHVHKLDTPSGTAIVAANEVLNNYPKFISWSNTERENCLPITSVREGEINGYHELCFRSVADEVKISHEAFNREGFAFGALKASEWIVDKNGLFNFRDVYKKIFKIA